MAGTVIDTVDDLQRYIAGVASRADHHAQGVGEVVLALAGAVVLFKDQQTEIRVMARAGETKNVLWVVIGGIRYALAYNHADQTVDVKEGGTQGDVIQSFDNSSTAADVIRFFSGLGSR